MRKGKIDTSVTYQIRRGFPMIKSLKMLTLCGLALMVMPAVATPRAEAGIIPWTYNAIFGPVGSTFPLRRTYRVPAYGFASPAVGACNTCNTCNYGGIYSAGYYSAGYTPYYSSYNYGGTCCDQGCVSGCPGGNCNAYIPATGQTPTPVDQGSAPPPTTTFRSARPEVDSDAVDHMNNRDSGRDSRYNEDPDGFETPSRPDSNNSSNGNGGGDAAPFNPFGGSGSSESLHVPATPSVPVEQRKPAPSDLETNGDLNLPPLRLVPAPVAFDETTVSWTHTPTVQRSQRSARYSIPTVARHVPDSNNPLLPPLPSPLQLVSK